MELDIFNVILDKIFIVNRFFNLFILFRLYNDISEVIELFVFGVFRSIEEVGSNFSFIVEYVFDVENVNVIYFDININFILY